MITKKMEDILREATDASIMTGSKLRNILINELYVINTNQAYDGFWGKNGYNNMVLVGYSCEDNKYYIISEAQCDIVRLWKTNSLEISIDIPEELNCIRLFGFKPLAIYNIASCITLTSKEELEKAAEEYSL